MTLEMVDGVIQEMSAEDQAVFDALQAAWPATQAAQQAAAALPDLPTQVANLTAALLAANVIPQNALPIGQLTATNNQLASTGQSTIALSASASILTNASAPSGG